MTHIFSRDISEPSGVDTQRSHIFFLVSTVLLCSFCAFCGKKMGKYAAVEPLLIEEVQKYPALWKTTDPEYKNRAAKDSAWEAITETVNAAANTTYSVLDYRDKIWKNLRDSYVRVLSGRNYKSLAYESVDMSKHPHLERLSFLKMYIYPKKATSKKHLASTDTRGGANIEPKSESDEDFAGDNTDLPTMANRLPLNRGVDVNGTRKDPQEHHGDNTEMPSTDLPTMADRLPSTSNPEGDVNGTPRPGKRPYEQTSPNGHEGSIDCRILQYLSRSTATTPCPCTQSREDRYEMDADGLFGQSVAAQLRVMDKKSNASAKVKIQQILLDVQFPENGDS